MKKLLTLIAASLLIADAGWPSAFIVETREPLYYVVALSTDTLPRAVAVTKTSFNTLV